MVFADTGLSIKPTDSDLSMDYVRNTAAAFFSRKCGLDEHSLKSADMEIDLWQSGRSLTADGKKVVAPYHDARWLIKVRSFPVPHHEHTHFLILTRGGELVSWAAHGGEYFEENPDLMKSGKVVTPLSTDAKAEEIIAKVKEDLLTIHGVEVTEKFSFKTAFVFHEYFNAGHAPVWLINVYQDGTLNWKGVYGYNGVYMSIVKPEQDYGQYATPNERFFWEVFDDEGMDISLDIQMGYEAEEDALKWLKVVTPKFETWIVHHPYYKNASVIDELIAKYAEKLK